MSKRKTTNIGELNMDGISHEQWIKRLDMLAHRAKREGMAGRKGLVNGIRLAISTFWASDWVQDWLDTPEGRSAMETFGVKR